MRRCNSILVIKMSALGDIIHALPSLHSLRTMFPEAAIHWVVEPRFKDLLPGPPWIDSTIFFDKAALKPGKLIGGLLDLRRRLKAAAPDLVIDLQGLLKSTLCAVLSGCSNRLGYCEMREGSRFFTRPIKGPNATGHVIERYRDVIRSLGPVPGELFFPLPDFADEAEQAKGNLAALKLGGPPAIIFPGAGWSSKLWPPENYAILARELSAKGLPVVIGGSSADGPAAQEIIAKARPLDIPDLTGSTSLKGLMGLVSQAAVCVGADTGPQHIAAAVGTPTVTLFGPSSAERAGTLGDRAANVSASAPCSPCFKRACPKEFICMDLIKPEAVLAACAKALSF